MISIVVIMVAVAVNPFGKSDQNDAETVDSPGVSTENGVNDESKYVPPPENDEITSVRITETVIMFHNDAGPMCVEALEFFEEHGIPVEEHLTTDEDFSFELDEYREEFNGVSEGVSNSFEYYPMIFIGGRAFSGFDSEVGQEILELSGALL